MPKTTGTERHILTLAPWMPTPKGAKQKKAKPPKPPKAKPEPLRVFTEEEYERLRRAGAPDLGFRVYKLDSLRPGEEPTDFDPFGEGPAPRDPRPEKRKGKRGLGGVAWFLPGAKKPFTRTTVAVSGFIEMLARDGYTPDLALDGRFLLNDAETFILRTYQQKGWGDMLLKFLMGMTRHTLDQRLKLLDLWPDPWFVREREEQGWAAAIAADVEKREGARSA